jgi:hypothetical protein
MGKRIVTFDDLDDTEEFSVDRNTWQMDLSDDNYAALLDALGPWITKAKKTRGPGIKSNGSATVPANVIIPDDPGARSPMALRFIDDDEPRRLEAWAAANGVRLARPGRPPAAVLEAFRLDDVCRVPDQFRLASA